MRKALRAVSDHPDSVCWNNTNRYIDFVEDADIKFYTLHPETVSDELYKVKCALVIEPRAFDCVLDTINIVKDKYTEFDYIFTHDDELLKLPNSRMFNWAGRWCDLQYTEKTKNLSIISSYYDWLPMYLERLKLARFVRDSKLGDAFGTFDGGSRVETVEAHAEYKFAIAVENHIEDMWFTEKIVNCLACRTVPIYIGARRIDKVFDTDGIIQASCADEVIEMLKDFDFDAEYNKRLSAIEENQRRSMFYTNPINTLYLTNFDIWERLWNS